MGLFKEIFHTASPAIEDGSGAAPAESASVKDGQMTDNEDAIETIRASLLFDEAWYRKEYGFGEYLDAAKHYLMQGWKEGREPSPFFSNEEYLSLYPDVRESGMNPLLHFELHGFAEGRYREQIAANRKKIAAAYPEYCTDLADGLLRIRITNACNAKCRYCGVRNNFGAEREHAMEPVWYYEYCKPLYEKVNVILITGGDAYIAKESYPYMQFMSENYPQITLMTESNGIAFDERFRRLAADHLFKTHFSVNSSNAEVFDRSCWEGEGGATVFPKLLENIREYVELLRKEDKLCFAPSLSMVINHDNVDDVREFVRLALGLHAWDIVFYFDYTENDMNGDYFGYPEQTRKVLRMLMEVERVLAEHVLVYFRLWIPAKEADPIQQEVEAAPIGELEEKYHDLLELCKGRSPKKEFDQRNAWRRKQGKRELTFYEDVAPSLRLERRQEQQMCFAPWGEIDLYPSGRMDFCGWFDPTLNLKDFIREHRVDWEEILNSFAYMSARKRILHSNFRGCQVCCPMNSVKNPITPVEKYNCGRIWNIEEW